MARAGALRGLNPVWRVDLDKGCSGPLVRRDRVFTLGTAEGDSDIVRALDQGDPGMMESGAFSSPVIAAIGDKRQILFQTRVTLDGVDPASGAVLWSRGVPSFRGMNILTPLVCGDSVFTSTGRIGFFLYKVPREREGFELKEAWRNKAKGSMPTPVIAGDYAYMRLRNQRFMCLDLRTGETKWTMEPFGQDWSMAVRGDKLLTLDERGCAAVSGDEVFVRELTGIAACRLISERRLLTE
jgi:outer membrane protein assembly factor BamB